MVRGQWKEAICEMRHDPVTEVTEFDNPDAGPLPDPDGSNNVFEFTAGLVPINTLTLFSFSVESGQPQIKRCLAQFWCDT